MATSAFETRLKGVTIIINGLNVYQGLSEILRQQSQYRKSSGNVGAFVVMKLSSPTQPGYSYYSKTQPEHPARDDM